MAKLTTTDLASLSNEASAIATINANFAAVEAVIEGLFSLDGTAPNTIADDIDMDSNKILNLPDATSNQEPATYSQLLAFTGQSIDDWELTGTLTVDTINEYTSATGVTVDGVLLKDNDVTATDVTASGVVTGATLVGTLTTAAQTNVTSLGTLSSLTISGDLTVDTNTLKVVSSSNQITMGNGEVGFGGLLNLDSDYNGSNIPQISLQDGISTLWHISANEANNNLYFAYGNAPGTAAFRLTNSGNAIIPSGSLGINTTSPDTELEVIGTAQVKSADSSTADALINLGGDATNVGARIAYTQSTDLLSLGTSHSAYHVNIASDGGIYTTSATGGSQGADTINASNYYKNGVAFGTGTGDLVAANNLSDVGDTATALVNLGIGALGTQSTINDDDWSGTDLAVANGGTGASTASGARTNLGLGALATLSTVSASEIDSSAVTTAKIQDDAVTLAKMAPGTAGDIIYMAGSTAPTYLGIGSSGEVLTVSGGVPTWAAQAGVTKHGTVHTSMSSASHAWSSIPSGTTYVKIAMSDISADAGDDLVLRINSVSSGYSGRVRNYSGQDSWSTFAKLTNGAGGLEVHNGSIEMWNITSNVWYIESQIATEGGTIHLSGGAVNVGAALSSVTLYWESANSFDAGNAALWYI